MAINIETTQRVDPEGYVSRTQRGAIAGSFEFAIRTAPAKLGRILNRLVVKNEAENASATVVDEETGEKLEVGVEPFVHLAGDRVARFTVATQVEQQTEPEQPTEQ